MLTILSRIIHYGFKNFWRNGLLSTAMIAIMTLSLLVFSGLIIANVATDRTISFLKDKIDISVYFKNTASEDSILNIKSALDGLPEVKSVEYISSDKALEIFKAEHADDPAERGAGLVAATDRCDAGESAFLADGRPGSDDRHGSAAGGGEFRAVC